MIGARHGETKSFGHEGGRAREVARSQGDHCRRLAPRASRAAARTVGRHVGADGIRPGSWPRHSRSVPGQGSQAADTSCGTRATLGWSSSRGDEHRGRARVPPAVGGVVGRWWHAGCRAPACCAGSGAGAARRTFGGVSAVSAPWLAQGGARHPAPQERPARAAAVEKNSPGCWQPAADRRQFEAGQSA